MHFVVPQEQAKTFFPDGIRIGKSNIPNAGDGLFATKKFHKGDLICEFPGFWIPTSAVKEGFWKGSLKDHYVFSVSGNTELSYMTHPCPANKINSHATGDDQVCPPPVPCPPLSWQAIHHGNTHTPHHPARHLERRIPAEGSGAACWARATGRRLWGPRHRGSVPGARYQGHSHRSRAARGLRAEFQDHRVDSEVSKSQCRL